MAFTGEEVVEYQLVKRIKDELQRALIDEVPSTDPSRPRTVVLGKYDGDYAGIVLSVHADHPLGFDRDRLNSSAERGASRAERYRPGHFPEETVGGSSFRHIFGTVQIRSVLDGYEPADAIAILALVKTKVAYTLNRMQLHDLSDHYGYHVAWLDCTDDYGYASGGSGTSADVHWVDWIALCTYPKRQQT